MLESMRDLTLLETEFMRDLIFKEHSQCVIGSISGVQRVLKRKAELILDYLEYGDASLWLQVIFWQT